MVYGHEQGLRILWKGGRPFTHQPRHVEKKPESNGAGEDAIMVIESDEGATEDSEQLPYQDLPGFEEEGGEADVSEPYEPFMQTLDLPLGVEVLHLAFPQLPQTSSLESLPVLFSQKLILAVACSDFSVRIILIPLLPHSKTMHQMRVLAPNVSAGKGAFGDQMIVLSSGITHRSIPRGLSVSMTPTPLENPEDTHMNEYDTSSNEADLQRSTSRSASRSCSRSRFANYQWDLLVASHSEDLSGLLLIHRIPISAGKAGLSSESHVPWRIEYLASPTISVHFNSALYPASRHSQLLIAEARGVVRILDCLPQPKAVESSWCLSLYTEFETLHDFTSRRKPILGALWVLGGKAILALLADGKWGIWDLANAGPKPTKGITPHPSTVVECMTRFALEGWVGESLKSRKLLRSSSAKIDNRSILAPMTPGTRKTKQQALFTEFVFQPDEPVRGGLSAMPIHGVSNIRANDDAVLVWHGDTIAVIPSLFTHWQNKARGSGNLFGSGAKGEPKMINNIQLGGESVKEVSLTPSHRMARNDTNYPEILVTGDHRLVILIWPVAEPPMHVSSLPPLFSPTTDQQLLTRGDLDVDGMNRILASISNSQTTPTHNPRPLSHTNGNQVLMS